MIDGIEVPSVTTILSLLSGPGLAHWRMRQVAEAAVAHCRSGEWDDLDVPELQKAAIKRLLDVPNLAGARARQRGLDVHEHVARWAAGEDQEDAYGWDAMVKAWDIKPMFSETVVACPGHYAGRFDLVADLDKHRWLLDVKTGKNLYRSTELQLSAYRWANFTEARDPVPPVDRTGVLWYRDHDWRLYETVSPQTDLDVVKACARLYRALDERFSGVEVRHAG